MDPILLELLAHFENIPGNFSAQTRVRLAEAYTSLRLAKAIETFAASITQIAESPIKVTLSPAAVALSGSVTTALSGTVQANVKDIK
jgi:hypothetical protein